MSGFRDSGAASVHASPTWIVFGVQGLTPDPNIYLGPKVLII